MAVSSLEDILRRTATRSLGGGLRTSALGSSSRAPSPLINSAGPRSAAPSIRDIQQSQSGGGLISALGKIPGLNIVGTALNAIDMPRRAVLSTVQELVDVVGPGDASLSDWKKQFDDPTFGFGTIVGDVTPNKWVNRGIGLIGDLVFDPLNYVSGSGVVGKLNRFAKGAEAATRGLGDDVVRELTTRGVARLDDATRAAVNAKPAGLRFGNPFAIDQTVRIPGTAKVDRAVGRALSAVRNKVTNTGPWTAIADRSAPEGMEDVYRVLRSGYDRNGKLSPSAAALFYGFNQTFKAGMNRTASTWSRGFAEVTKGMDEKSRVALTRATERGEATPLTDAFAKFRDDLVRAGVDVGEIDNYMPHLWTPEARNLLFGDSEGAREMRRVLNIDMNEAPGITKKRSIRAGSELSYNGKTVVLQDGSIDEINTVLKELFPSAGVGKWLEDDAAKLLDFYVRDGARAVGMAEAFKGLLAGGGDLVQKLDAVSTEVLDRVASQTADKEMVKILGGEIARRKEAHKLAVQEAVDQASRLQGEVVGALRDRLSALGDAGVRAAQDLERVKGGRASLTDAAAELRTKASQQRKKVKARAAQLEKEWFKLDAESERLRALVATGPSKGVSWSDRQATVQAELMAARREAVEKNDAAMRKLAAEREKLTAQMAEVDAIEEVLSIATQMQDSLVAMLDDPDAMRRAVEHGDFDVFDKINVIVAEFQRAPSSAVRNAEMAAREAEQFRKSIPQLKEADAAQQARGVEAADRAVAVAIDEEFKALDDLDKARSAVVKRRQKANGIDARTVTASGSIGAELPSRVATSRSASEQMFPKDARYASGYVPTEAEELLEKLTDTVKLFTSDPASGGQAVIRSTVLDEIDEFLARQYPELTQALAEVSRSLNLSRMQSAIAGRAGRSARQYVRASAEHFATAVRLAETIGLEGDYGMARAAMLTEREWGTVAAAAAEMERNAQASALVHAAAWAKRAEAMEVLGNGLLEANADEIAFWSEKLEFDIPLLPGQRGVDRDAIAQQINELRAQAFRDVSHFPPEERAYWDALLRVESARQAVRTAKNNASDARAALRAAERGDRWWSKLHNLEEKARVAKSNADRLGASTVVGRTERVVEQARPIVDGGRGRLPYERDAYRMADELERAVVPLKVPDGSALAAAVTTRKVKVSEVQSAADVRRIVGSLPDTLPTDVEDRLIVIADDLSNGDIIASLQSEGVRSIDARLRSAQGVLSRASEQFQSMADQMADDWLPPKLRSAVEKMSQDTADRLVAKYWDDFRRRMDRVEGRRNRALEMVDSITEEMHAAVAAARAQRLSFAQRASLLDEAQRLADFAGRWDAAVRAGAAPDDRLAARITAELLNMEMSAKRTALEAARSNRRSTARAVVRRDGRPIDAGVKKGRAGVQRDNKKLARVLSFEEEDEFFKHEFVNSVMDAFGDLEGAIFEYDFWRKRAYDARRGLRKQYGKAMEDVEGAIVRFRNVEAVAELDDVSPAELSALLDDVDRAGFKPEHLVALDEMLPGGMGDATAIPLGELQLDTLSDDLQAKYGIGFSVVYENDPHVARLQARTNEAFADMFSMAEAFDRKWSSLTGEMAGNRTRQKKEVLRGDGSSTSRGGRQVGGPKSKKGFYTDDPVRDVMLQPGNRVRARLLKAYRADIKAKDSAFTRLRAEAESLWSGTAEEAANNPGRIARRKQAFMEMFAKRERSGVADIQRTSRVLEDLGKRNPRFTLNELQKELASANEAVANARGVLATLGDETPVVPRPVADFQNIHGSVFDPVYDEINDVAPELQERAMQFMEDYNTFTAQTANAGSAIELAGDSQRVVRGLTVEQWTDRLRTAQTNRDRLVEQVAEVEARVQTNSGRRVLDWRAPLGLVDREGANLIKQLGNATVVADAYRNVREMFEGRLAEAQAAVAELRGVGEPPIEMVMRFDPASGRWVKSDPESGMTRGQLAVMRLRDQQDAVRAAEAEVARTSQAVDETADYAAAVAGARRQVAAEKVRLSELANMVESDADRLSMAEEALRAVHAKFDEKVADEIKDLKSRDALMGVAERGRTFLIGDLDAKKKSVDAALAAAPTLKVTDRNVKAVGDKFKDMLDLLDPNDPSSAVALAAYDDYLSSLAKVKREEDGVALLKAFRKAAKPKKVNGIVVQPSSFVQIYKRVANEGFVEVGEVLGKENMLAVAEPLGELITNFQKVLDDGSWLEVVELGNRFFKTYATLSPGFHLRNLMGATWVNMSDGVGISEHREAFRLWSEYAKDPIRFLERAPQKVRDAFDAAFASGAGGRLSIGEVGAGGAKNKTAQRIYETKTAQVLLDNRLVELSRRVGTDWVEGPIRLAMALNSVNNGASAVEAASRITRTHFDYSELSRLDRRMKALLPFWVFMSRNLPLQMQQIVMRPRMYQLYSNIVRNFSDDDVDMLKWQQERGGIGLSPRSNLFGKNEGLVLLPDLQHLNLQDDLSKLNPLNFPRGLSQANPMYRVPVELAMGRKLYSDAPFYPDESKLQYALTQMIPTYAQASRLGAFGQYSDRSKVQSLLNYTGIPLWSVNEQQLRREMERRAAEG